MYSSFLSICVVELQWFISCAPLVASQKLICVGYIFSELINTYKINNWIAANLSSKYFLSGLENFGAIGGSVYVSLSDNLQIIPEINYALDKNFKSNNTISIRYSLNENKSIDLYLSNAMGTQDLGQLLRAKNNRIGLKINLLY